MTTPFHGWKFGGNLTTVQADELEPIVDAMTDVLKIVLTLSPDWSRPKSQHEIALALVEHTGAAAGIINDISFLLVEEKNPEEQLLQLNAKATSLRAYWLVTAAVALKAVTNLDEQLKGEDNAPNTNIPD